MTLCVCCSHFDGMAGYEGYCDWCIDCPTGYCDIPERFLVKNEQKEKSLQGLSLHRDGETDQGAREGSREEKRKMIEKCGSCDQMKKENTNTRKALLETSKQYVEVINENLALRRKIEILEKRLYGERF